MTDLANPLGLRGIDFIEYASPRPEELHRLFQGLGFSRTHAHKARAIDLYAQHDITFLVNRERGTHADAFQHLHGPSISGLGLRVENARIAFDEALRRGARAHEPSPGERATLDLPAIEGIGGALIYFVDRFGERGSLKDTEFAPLPSPALVATQGFLRIDHLTNNVEKGTLRQWADFYERIFGFKEIRAFDIRGEYTGLYSFALKSPCGTFSIPINEGTESKSQIEEYLREYKGPGVQHVALLSEDILASLDAMQGRVPTLDIDADYYATVFDRVPNVAESRERIAAHQVLVDGDDKGYLLQIFTKNVIGPIFFEIIQRRNHLSFGEGNFGALFRSIERDQQRRGAL